MKHILNNYYIIFVVYVLLRLQLKNLKSVINWGF